MKQLDISKESCSDALSRILDKSGMDSESNAARILEYLVTETLEGKENLIKGFSIGQDVMGKDASFDPSNDSSVRVEMKRLRDVLKHYYSTAGSTDPVQIDIPLGSYVPVFLQAAAVEKAPPRASILPALRNFALAAVVLVALGLIAVNASKVEPSIPHTITVQISGVEGPDDKVELVRSALTASLLPGVTIALVDPADPSLVDARANFYVTARVNSLLDGDLLSIRLSESVSHKIFWIKNIKVPSDAELYDVVEHDIGAELRIRLFGASKQLLQDVDPERLDADALFVLATWVPGVATNAISWEKSRIAMASLALEKSPDYGAAHSVLADKLAYLANVYSGVDGEEYMARAKSHAQRALETAPLDPDVVFNVAQSKWHSGLLDESRLILSRVMELDPNHDIARFLALVTPYTCAQAPDYVLRAAIAFDAALSANNPIRWLTLTWISWLQAYRGEFDVALATEERAALIFQFPYSFMRHAMILDQLGRPDEAVQVFRRQQRNWAGFDPLYFAQNTIPRLCGDSPDTEMFVQQYGELAITLKAGLIEPGGTMP